MVNVTFTLISALLTASVTTNGVVTVFVTAANLFSRTFVKTVPWLSCIYWCCIKYHRCCCCCDKCCDC